MALPIFQIVVAGAVYVGVKMVNAQKARVLEGWDEAARAFDLHIEPGGKLLSPKLSGRIDEIRIEVDVHPGPAGRERKGGYTRYVAHHGLVGPPVSMRKHRKFFDSLMFLAERDVTVGNPFFDDTVVVDTDQDDAIRAFLSPTRQAVILEAFNLSPAATITHSSITLYMPGIAQASPQLIEMISRLIDMAKVMGSPSELDAVLAKQQNGDIDEAIQELQAMNAAQPNIFTQTLEAEARIDMGDHQGAAAVYDNMSEQLPVEHEATAWERIASSPAPVALPAPVSLPAPAALPGPSLALKQQVVIDDLFDPGRMSFEIIERFEASYVNQVVTWRGEVTNVHAYRHDTDFENEPGTKVTVLLGSTGRSSWISNQVHAVVQLPVGAAVNRGDEMEFVGTLRGVDRFGRKIYVVNAALT